jgi:hypothetical protein
MHLPWLSLSASMVLLATCTQIPPATDPGAVSPPAAEQTSRKPYALPDSGKCYPPDDRCGVTCIPPAMPCLKGMAMHTRQW